MSNSVLGTLAKDAAQQHLVPLKAMLPEYRADVLASAQVQQVYAGQRLFEQDIFDGKHVYLLRGGVELQFSSGLMLKVLHSDFAAQYPLANVQPRACRGLAASDCVVLRIDSDALDQALACSQVLQYAEHDLEQRFAQSPLPDWMRTVLHSALFRQVPAVNVEQILRAMTEVKVRAGDNIVVQGDAGDSCYFIRQGRAAISRATAGQVNFAANIAPGDCFAEEVLLNDCVHSASVTMLEDGIILRLGREAFTQLQQYPSIKQWGYPQFVRAQTEPDFDQTACLIDVRTREEYLQGHIPTAISLPLSQLHQVLTHFDVAKRYLFCCDTGRRSQAATHLLASRFQVAMLAGGINDEAWRPIISTSQARCFINGRVQFIDNSVAP